MQIDGPGASLDAGVVTLSGPDIVVEDHGTFRASRLSVNNIAVQFILDATSTAEIGGGSIATAGTLAVDAGAIAMVDGTIDAPILDQGTIETAASLVLAGAVSGDGTIELNGTYDLLVLNGAVAAGMTIDFADRIGVLELPELSAGTVGATIAGFAAGDEIDIRAAGVNGVIYTATGNSIGTLTFTANGATVETLTIAGDYAGQTFLLLPDLGIGATAALVLAPNTPTTPVAAVAGSGTGTFSWQLVNGGSWDDPSNWSANGRVPGAANPVMINAIDNAVFGKPGAVAIVNGDGNSASLSIAGSVALNGTFDTGFLTDTATMNGRTGTLDLLAGTVVTALSAATDDVLVNGAGASLSVFGNLTVGFNSDGIQGLVLTGGGRVTADSLTLDDASVSLDGMSTVEIGSGGHASSGTLVIDPGALLTVAGGTIDCAVLNDGTLLAGGAQPGGSVVLAASVSGSGTLQLVGHQIVVLQSNVAASETIEFSGPSATLDLTGAGSLTGLIGGLAISDAILVGANVASVRFDPTGAGSGILTLTDQTGAVVRSLNVSGELAGGTFVLLPRPGYGSSFYSYDIPVTSEIVLASGTLQAGAPPPASPGTASGQTFTWTATGGGAWNDAGNWSGGVVPGRFDTVTFGSEPAIEIISGSGNVAGVNAEVNAEAQLALSGVFSFGTLQSDSMVSVLQGATLTVGELTASPITVSGDGATLDVTGTADLGGAINGGSLLITDSGAVQLGAVRLDSESGIDSVGVGGITLQVDASSTLEIGTSGGAARGAITIDAGEIVEGPAVLDLRGIVHNAGVVGASSIEGSVDGNGTLLVGGSMLADFRLPERATLTIDGSVAATQTIRFDAEHETLILSQPTNATIVGYDQTDTIEVIGYTSQVAYTPTGGNLGQLAIGASDETTAVLTLEGDYSTTRFVAEAMPPQPTQLTAQTPLTEILIAACFAEGTRIATEHGAVAIEHLTVGTLVHTPWNQLLPVEWIGRRRTDCRHHPRPHDVWPVRVSAHAFGPNRPVRDLFLSPDHAVHIDGPDGPDLLIPVRYLINDATIRQIATDEVTYWHIELPRHDVVLAEGLSCESYLDTGNRCAFENGGPAVALHPDFARAIWNEQACAELTLAGPALTAVRAMLLANARALGHLATDDAGLTVHADGQMLEATGPLTFDLPAGTKTVTLTSKTAVPAHVHADAQDYRRLGVAIADLMFDGVPLPPDDPRFAAGWFPAEPEWRWTNGHAALATGGATRLSLRLKPYLTYWVADDVRPEPAPASPPTRARPEKPSPKRRRAGRGGRAARL